MFYQTNEIIFLNNFPNGIRSSYELFRSVLKISATLLIFTVKICSSLECNQMIALTLEQSHETGSIGSKS